MDSHDSIDWRAEFKVYERVLGGARPRGTPNVYIQSTFQSLTISLVLSNLLETSEFWLCVIYLEFRISRFLGRLVEKRKKKLSVSHPSPF